MTCPQQTSKVQTVAHENKEINTLDSALQTWNWTVRLLPNIVKNWISMLGKDSWGINKQDFTVKCVITLWTNYVTVRYSYLWLLSFVYQQVCNVHHIKKTNYKITQITHNYVVMSHWLGISHTNHSWLCCDESLTWRKSLRVIVITQYLNINILIFQLLITLRAFHICI